LRRSFVLIIEGRLLINLLRVGRFRQHLQMVFLLVLKTVEE
jgi:hypothetical protein